MSNRVAGGGKKFPIPIVVCMLLCALSYAAEIREYPSPNGMLIAVVITQESKEARIELRSKDGPTVLSQTYASQDGEHGFGLDRAAWTADSRFFVYSLFSSGGHQPWCSPTDFIEASTLSVHRLDDYLGPVIDPDFTISPPDIVRVAVQGKDMKEGTREVSLSELVNSGKKQ
jgi:hypothetical protein